MVWNFIFHLKIKNSRASDHTMDTLDSVQWQYIVFCSIWQLRETSENTVKSARGYGLVAVLWFWNPQRVHQEGQCNQAGDTRHTRGHVSYSS